MCVLRRCRSSKHLLDVGEGEGAGDDVACRAHLVEGAVTHHVVGAVHAHHAAVTVVDDGVVGLGEVVRPAKLDEVFPFAVVGGIVVGVGHEVVEGAHPGVPAAADTVVDAHRAALDGDHLSERDEQFSGGLVILRLVAVAAELVGEFFQPFPGLALVVGEGDEGAGHPLFRAGDEDERVIVRVADDLHLAHAVLFRLLGVVGHEQFGRGPVGVPVLVEGEVGLVDVEGVVVEEPHPLVDVLSVFLDLREGGHRDDGVRGGVEFLELAPSLAVVVGEGEVEAVRLILRRHPIGAAGDHHQLLAAVGEVQVVEGGGLLRVGKTCGQSRHSVRPGEPHIVAYAHRDLSLAVPERVHDDDLALFGAVVHPDGIGVRDVAARFFHRDRGVEGEMCHGEIDEVARLVQSAEVRGDEDDR